MHYFLTIFSLYVVILILCIAKMYHVLTGERQYFEYVFNMSIPCPLLCSNRLIRFAVIPRSRIVRRRACFCASSRRC